MARQMSRVTAVIRGISTIGFRFVTLILRPKYPFWRVSKTITWNKYMGKVFSLMILRTRLPRGNFASTVWLGMAAMMRNKVTEAIITLKLDASRKN